MEIKKAVKCSRDAEQGNVKKDKEKERLQNYKGRSKINP